MTAYEWFEQEYRRAGENRGVAILRLAAHLGRHPTTITRALAGYRMNATVAAEFEELSRGLVSFREMTLNAKARTDGSSLALPPYDVDRPGQVPG